LTTEYIQFAGALVLFLGILIGSYWFVYAPTRKNYKRDRQRNRFGG
jgi:cbb3-type cytochrome oxidase subunit 3